MPNKFSCFNVIIWGLKGDLLITGHFVTYKEILDHGKPPSKPSVDKGINVEEGMSYEIVKKDLNALTKQEQMDVVYRLV